MFRLSIVLSFTRLALAPEPSRYTPCDEKLRIVLLRIVPDTPVRFTPVTAHSMRACSITTLVAELPTSIPRQEPRDGEPELDVSTTFDALVPLTINVPLTVSSRPLPKRTSVPGCRMSVAPASTTRSAVVTVYACGTAPGVQTTVPVIVPLCSRGRLLTYSTASAGDGALSELPSHAVADIALSPSTSAASNEKLPSPAEVVLTCSSPLT